MVAAVQANRMATGMRDRERLLPRARPSRPRSRSLILERLEERLCLALPSMSVAEQHLHELINWARAHPSEAAARYGVELNEGLPSGTITADAKSPLARNDLLRAAVTGHVRDMVQNDFFSHTGSDNSQPRDRIVKAGYTPYRMVAENLVWWGVSGASLPDQFQVVENLVREWFKSAGHRKTLMNSDYREVGTALIIGPFTQSGTTYDAGVSGQNFGTRNVDQFLTGTGCISRRPDVAVCDVTKPIPAASVTATRASDQLTRQTTTGPTGEYDLQLPVGTWHVRIAGGGLPEAIDVSAVTIEDRNVKLDFVPVVSTRWRNAANPLDVNNDRLVTPLDALVVINAINAQGPRPLPPITSPPTFFFDADGDNYLSPKDALLVINRLNSPATGEAERAAPIAGVLVDRMAATPDTDEVLDAIPDLPEMLALSAAAIDALLFQEAAMQHLY